MTQHSIVASPPPPLARTPKIQALPGTTDTHFHIFGPTAKYPLSPARMYDPALSPISEYRAMADTIGIERMVVVQASVYGTDNSCLLDSIARLGLKRTRGVAVVDQSITMDELNRMDRAGVRGIRFNAITGRTPIEWLPRLAKMIEPLGWHIQLWINSGRLLEIGSILNDLSLRIVLDHMGHFPMQDGVEGSEFKNILRLLENDRFWIKLVGYRLSKLAPNFADLSAPAKALIAAAPERCIWGTDWPHIFLEDKPMPNTTDLFELANSWMSKTDVQRIFVDNPARLYSFE
ncbi:MULTISPECIES: amidohydrolase family protein [Bradyrhizobium]|uniref:Predicted metal-dependent hydrolase, TIM-barrel fold n=2 Tax=Bradyrhizobium TaxID=374 RepID=A0ABY0PJD4_9BRAD|nr:MULTISPECIES: amidohydrolase family protein [Bradyrhizobium]SDI19758.1 Predicted metal-dependent hydrolase, TIM-barrel fold [Bradyrhizobium ottawaense]SED74761.1 Predicted metal-dependent hydrolase, TIM-barrel fold [Bradyrhizobium lablabi]SHL70371.1 Predicted metal-dependent hydrolase, TIM-barrel fold [Bradyrhizobium lablabi]